MQPQSLTDDSHLFRFLAENGAFNVGAYNFPAMQSSFCSNFNSNLCSGYDYNEISNCNINNQQTIERSVVTDAMTPQDRALIALKNHKEAEKRRRERINAHLDRLRALLPCTSKTDKASLLAKVVQRLRELKHQTSQITGLETFPSESDEISVLSSYDDDHDQYYDQQQLIFKASLCCEDRSDLMPELIEVLKSLNLKIIRAEMATLGGRMRNVLIVAADKDHSIESVQFLQNSLKSLLDRSNNSTDQRSKRRRVLDNKLVMQ